MKKSGFTLVELAIVITIIGLLIGGVLKGQELLENARVTSVSNSMKAYETAYIAFNDIYKGKPGDLLNAQNFLEGCTSGNACVNGNGDGTIGATASFPSTTAAENSQFWKHLALAKLISGVDPTASTLAFGRSNPSNPIVGGYLAIPAINAANADLQGNLVGRFGIEWYTLVVPTDYNQWPASVKQAWQIDVKLDDGKPFTGNVRSGSVPNNGGHCEADASGNLNNYNPGSTSAEKCWFRYVLEQ